MRSSRRLLFVLALVVGALLVTGLSFAAEPHSACITGAPLVLGGGPDSQTNTMIALTCGDHPSCCSTRWGLSCVQNAARIARDTQSRGDICGRYAWAQGPVPGTTTYFPRDFNLFVLSGEARAVRDSDGPVAASGNVNLNFFHLNVARREPVALIAGGPVTIYSGTVNGSTLYRSSYSDPSVTYVDGVRPSAATNPFPIDFAAASTKLNAMSQALKKYEAIPATSQYGTITFTGTDPELNVFTLPSTMLTGATTYAFNIPSGSNIIVNVSGTNASFANAGFSGSGLIPNRMLWNFPDATALSITGVGFYGSILAPKATATFRNGSVYGTIVVANGAQVDVELYAPFYRPPSAIGAGALEVDPTWSFTGAVSDDSSAASFSSEAGFIELARDNYVAENTIRYSPTHRVWYSFQPAAVQAKTKPLAVFFNGGPGSATSSILFSFNTGPWTLDPAVVGAQKIVATNSAANWSQFANLLYIDAPSTGFSYAVAQPDGTKDPIGIDVERDASLVSRVVLRFLKRHPEILGNRVIIVGESYGGVRATYMLDHLYNYQAVGNPFSSYLDAPLYDEELDYFSRVLGTANPTAAQIATKWGHQVLISPAVAGDWQTKHFTLGTADAFNYSVCKSLTCSNLIPQPGGGGTPNTCDDYNCDKDLGFYDDIETKAAKNLVQISILSKAVNAPVENIEWLKGPSRTRAYGRATGKIIPAPEMVSLFGMLQPEDNYFLRFNDEVDDGYPGASGSSDASSLATATRFATQLHNGVATFITATKFDLVIYSPEIPYAFKALRTQFPELANIIKGGVGYQRNGSNGLARPGLFSLAYDTAQTDIRSVPMPFYTAGHSVTQRAPVELLTDVKQWYNNSPH